MRRVLCNNPSPFTFTGTVSYIVGQGKVAIIDPGPDDEAHAKALLDAVRGETVTHILVTHPSRPLAEHRADQGRHRRARLCGGAASRLAAAFREREAQSGIRRRPRLSGPTSRSRTATSSKGTGWALEAVATPGHTANHLAFAWPERKINFVGDHVMGWSTSIVAPPDGSMIDYMASLDAAGGRDEDLYFSAMARKFRKARVTSASWPGTAGRARPRSCIGSPRARPISRPWCARSISASIRG